MASIRESREIPVRGCYDVIVAGAGVAGLAAAVAIRRAGRSVLMFENEWSIRLACENNEGLVLAETADRMVADEMDF